MTPERLLEIRRHHVRGCSWCSDVPELLSYVDELTARLSEYEVAGSTAKQWQAEIQWSEARAEAAEQDAFDLNAALTSAEALLEEARGLIDVFARDQYDAGPYLAFLAKLEKRDGAK